MILGLTDPGGGVPQREQLSDVLDVTRTVRLAPQPARGRRCAPAGPRSAGRRRPLGGSDRAARPQDPQSCRRGQRGTRAPRADHSI